MKKSYSPSDNFGVTPSFEDWGVATSPTGVIVPSGFGDDGDSFPRASTSASSVSVSAASAKPVATIAQLADYLVNGFWAYNSTVAHHWSSNTISYNISGLNAAEQILAQSALEAWHEVANVNFVQTSGAANIAFNDSGTMTAFTSANWTGSGAMTSATVDISADWITNDGGSYDGKTGIDSYGYQTYIHEIGHALGLGHQGPYNGSATYSTDTLYADDTWQYSIMSYFAQDNYSGSTYRYVVTPQIADIYAVDSIYGPATTRTGDTVYGFHSTAGAVFDFSTYSQAPALTIYDSGGNDTLDCSGYSAAQTIDLHPGAFSSVGGLVHNIGISTNTIIETAVAGSGNDTLIANDSGCTLIGGAGNDTLIGGAGNDRIVAGSGVDTMTGGGGAETFVFNTGDSSPVSGQHDRITDFVSGIDHIDLSGIDAISSTSGHDLFDFISTAAFDGSAGELDYSYNNALGVTVLQGDTNGDRVADFAIDLVGNITISLSDLIGAAVIPIVIEASGVTSLTQLGGNYFLDASGTSTGPSLKYGGSPAVSGQIPGWAPIGAEQISGGGYEVAWKEAGASLYTLWTTDSNGNFVSYISAMPGNSAVLESAETTFHQDINGDGTIGIRSTVIEAFGSTSLVAVANNYYLDGVSSGTGPELIYGGSPVVAGQIPGWAPIGAEQISGGGYEVVWKEAGASLYTLWTTDSNANFLSYISAMPGNSAVLESAETNFHQDINGDGTIGIGSTVIEAFGSTSLVAVANNYYLDGVSSGTGPELIYGGSPVVAGQIPGWAPIGAEQISGGGYEVVWKEAGYDQYTIWTTDSSGNFVSYISAMPGSSAVLEAAETTFHQDLNGDGTLGAPAAAHGTVIEALGSTSLVAVGNNYYLDGISSGTGPELIYGGSPVVAGQIPGWAPIGAEQISGGGYEVGWKEAGYDQYTIWTVDSSGNFVSYISAMPGSSAVLEAAETTFHQDLNGDGVIGVPVAAVAASGENLLTSNLPSRTDWVAGAGNDTFVFNSAAPNAEAPNAIVLNAFSSDIQLSLLQEARSEQSHVLLQSAIVDHGSLIDLTGHEAATLTKVQIADLPYAGIFIIR